MALKESLKIGRTIGYVALLVPFLSFCTSRTASAYSFSLDRFEMTGNEPGAFVDEFDDGDVAPWEIYDPTVAESGGYVTFSTPGTVETAILDGVSVVMEMSFIGSGNAPVRPVNGSGDFTGISRWTPVIPAVDEWYEMQIGYTIQEEPRIAIDISLGVANWGPTVADFLNVPSGLGISFYRSTDKLTWQHVLIDESDLTEPILLRLDFEDSSDEFTASFSLDGGATYQSPFTPLGWGMDTPGRYAWSFAGQAIRSIEVPGTIMATIDIDPDTLNMKSDGQWVTCYISLPAGNDVADIAVNSVLLEAFLEVQQSDIQGDVLMVKFDRQDLITYLETVLGVTPPTDVELSVVGELTDGTPLEGADTIRVIKPGKEQ
jgi:hypothetical protein